MDIELILPSEMTLEGLADRLAGAAWSVLVRGAREPGAYPATLGDVTAAILDRLNEMRVGETDLGGIHSVQLSCDAPAAADALEAGLTSAIARRVTGVLSDLRAVQLITHDLPDALCDILRPYEWVEPGSDGRLMVHGM